MKASVPDASEAKKIKPPSGSDEPTGSLDEALIKAYAQIVPIDRNAEGQIQNRKYQYATLGEINEHLRPILSELGLAVIQTTITEDRDGVFMVGCRTEIIHSSGESRSSDFVVPVASPTPQSMGSTVTYAKRYSYPFFIQADESDDDGAAGSAGGQNYQRTSARRSSGPPSASNSGRGGQSAHPPSRTTPSPSSRDEIGEDIGEEFIQRNQAVTLTGLASRRANEFEDVNAIDVLNNLAQDKGMKNWEEMWPKIRVRQMAKVSEAIREWSPP